MKVIEGGVTAAKGYKAAGLRAGIKAGKTNKDMAMICSEKEAVCAGTFTKNVVKAAPVFWDKDVVYKEGKAPLMPVQEKKVFLIVKKRQKRQENFLVLLQNMYLLLLPE